MHSHALHGNKRGDVNMRHVVITNGKHRNEMKGAKHSTEMNEAVCQVQGRHKSG